MTLTLALLFLFEIAYIIIYYISLLYAILYALGKFDIINESNDFYQNTTSLLQKFLSPLLNAVRRIFKFTEPYDYSPFILYLFIYTLPIIVAILSACFGVNIALNMLPGIFK